MMPGKHWTRGSALALWLCASSLAAQAPLDPETRFTIALTHLREGRLQMALDEMRRAIKDDPKNPYFQKGLGLAYMQQRDFDKAVEAFRKALELNPYYVDVRNDLGTALVLQGKREEGKKEFLTAFNDPTYNAPEVAARNLAQACFEEKDYQQAYNWYHTSALRNPKYVDAHLGQADALLAMNQAEQAVSLLQGAARDLPDSLQIRLGLGDALYRSGRFGEARQELEAVASKDPTGLGRRAADMLKHLPK